MSKLKVCFLDTEITPDTAYVWKRWDTNVIDIERDWHFLSYSVKWQNGKTETLGLPNFKGYRADNRSDKALVWSLWQVFDDADIIITHNGDRADIRWATARFLVHGLPPPRPYKTVDTCKLARRYFGFHSNKLDDLARQLGIGRKLHHTGFALWKACMDGGDMKAWAMMLRYNEHDVRLLEKVYMKLRGWAQTHPPVTVPSDRPVCPKCGSQHVTREGWSFTQQRRKRRYQCQNCAGWFTGAPEKREVKSEATQSTKV